MARRSIALLFLCLLVLPARAQEGIGADHLVLAPVKSASLREAVLHPIPQKLVEGYLERLTEVHTFRVFEGQNDLLAEEAEAAVALGEPPLLARGSPTDMNSAQVFGEPFVDGAFHVWEAAVVSTDAVALRLRVDLSMLAEGEEVYVIDTTAPRAFGPYGRRDHVDGGRWLATTEGGVAVLAARSVNGARPRIRMVGLSHFFRTPSPMKLLSCHMNVMCESRTWAMELAPAIGLMLIPRTGGDVAYGTGALINNSNTPAVTEPYFLTSWRTVPRLGRADQVEVLWDYWAATCMTDNAPALSTLLRNTGLKVLATDSSLNITLMELGGTLPIPRGPRGRTYLGWLTASEPLATGESAVTLHHPDGSHLRVSYGTIKALDQSGLGHSHLTLVQWTQGVSEDGSEGAPLLLPGSDYRIGGTLGPHPATNACSAGVNQAYFSSFRRFAPAAWDYLTGVPDTPDPPDPPPNDPGDDGTSSGGCAAIDPGGPNRNFPGVGRGDFIVIVFAGAFLALLGRRRSWRVRPL